MAKSVNYKTYKKKFEKFVEKKIPVKGTKFDTEVSEIIENANDFRQCYAPDFKVRKQLPKYWFISKEGFLVSVKGDKPKWIKPDLSSGRPTFKPSPDLKDWVKNKSISTYDLVALAWGSTISDDAYYLLDTVGAAILGCYEKDERKLHKSKVQGHHWKIPYIHEMTLENYIKNNNPENVQIVTTKEHHLLEKLAEVKTLGSFSFKAPTYRKVYSEAPTVYLMDEMPRIAHLKDLEIIGLLGVNIESSETVSLEIGNYEFVSSAGADFIEDNKTILSMIAEQDHTKYNYEIHYGKKYYFADIKLVEDTEMKRVFYRKIK